MKADHNRKNLIIAGPTASGKTALAHGIADELRLRGEEVCLFNLDAFQFYRGFDLGTAKPSQAELLRYGYRFVDILDPHETVDAQELARQARSKAQQENENGKRVIAVGGSGLYIRSLLHGLDPLPSRNEEIRHFLRDCASSWGWPHLHARWLSVLDPERAHKVHPNDGVRIERALEIYLESGQTATSQFAREAPQKQQDREFAADVICVLPPQAIQHERIRVRTKELFQAGWKEEVRRLLDAFGDNFFDLPASRAIGYREIARDLLAGGRHPEELQALVEMRTRQYAKRQRTWMGSAWIDALVEDLPSGLVAARRLLHL